MRLGRRGMTLLELLVALVLLGGVALLAHGLVGSVADAQERTRLVAEQHDREGNAPRWLATAFGGVEVGQPGDSAFVGTRHDVRFTTRLPVPGGWSERRTVRLTLSEPEEGPSHLVAIQWASDALDTLRLAEGVDELEIDYLMNPGAAAAWVPEWVSPVSAPVAVRLRLRHGGLSSPPPESAGRATTEVDTLLLLVGARG
ncbi:MAG TPA: prepilin-type N-terminal cleavage/methylation domain-containing protein [Gemmatimonadales bacterium]|nr:prepilin-type N-terminal cleavage/methylation domain-containing protein [Gemmatimonadales bacterium]